MGRKEGLLTSSVVFRLSRFSKPYRHRLLTGLRDLEMFCTEEVNCSLKQLLSHVSRTDEVLAQYVMRRHSSSEGQKLYLVKHALLCCQHIQPRLKGQITTAWENLRVWEEKHISKLRPPLPVPLWLMMIGLARGHAVTDPEPEKRLRWDLFGILIEVGLLCMFRPGELLKLRHSDFSLPGDFTFSQPFAAIRIANPKNRRQFGLEQFVLLRNPCTIQKLRGMLIEGLDVPLWKDKPTLFGQLFRTICKELKITECRFTPASLRPGGATLYYGQGIPISTLRFMGRWTVERSLEHYIQLAMSTQIMNKLTPSVICRLKKLSPLCLDLVIPRHGRLLLEPLSDRERLSSAAITSWCNRYAALEGQALREDSSWRSPSRTALQRVVTGTARSSCEEISR